MYLKFNKTRITKKTFQKYDFQALKLSFSLLMNCIVPMGSPLPAWLCTVPIITLMNGFIFFSSPIVEGTYETI